MMHQVILQGQVQSTSALHGGVRFEREVHALASQSTCRGALSSSLDTVEWLGSASLSCQTALMQWTESA